MPARPSYSAGKFAMQLDGIDVGFVVTVAGGEPFGAVVAETPVGVTVGKHLGGVHIAPLVVEISASMGEPLRSWISVMLDGTQTPKDGAIAFLDYALREHSRLEFAEALITEVAFPAADASSKESARMRVTIQPESSRFVAGSGVTHPVPTIAKGHKAWQVSTFWFTVSGLESIGNKVAKVAPMVVRRTVVADATGATRPIAMSTGVLDVSDVVFWLPESEAAPVETWFEDFVVKGNNDSSNERTASLTFLEPSSRDELLRLELDGVGIFRISHERDEANAGVLARVKVEMYCESVKLAVPTVVATPPATPSLSPVSAAVESLASALAAALRAGPGSAIPSAEALTERLLASVETAPAGDSHDRGRAAGKKWAMGHARLDELDATAALAERDDWTALALGEGHTLVAFLAANGDLAADESGPVDLARDRFTTGLVAGAADVYRGVAGRIRERRLPNV